MKVSKSKKQKKLIGYIARLFIIALVIDSAVLTLMSLNRINAVFYTNVSKSLSAAGYLMNQTMMSSADDTMELDSDGKVYQGAVDVTDKDMKILDNAKKASAFDYTIILDKKSALSTIENAQDKKKRSTATFSEDILKKAARGNGYFESSISIEGRNYCAYFRTLTNAKGNAVGYIVVAEDRNAADHEILGSTLMMIAIALCFLVVLTVIAIRVTNRESKNMNELSDQIRTLADGNLSIRFDKKMENRNDELGTISRNVNTLDEKLISIIGETKRMTGELDESSTNLSNSSDQANSASNQVSSAVGDIAKGATNQADSVQTAANDTSSMDADIDQISENITQLKDYASEMKDSCSKTVDAIRLLAEQSKDVTQSVNDIGDTIGSTNDSVQEISKFSGAITDIAKQTNLLSLNASIEAARAGEAGRGFAVVADEIRDLADQSKKSADQISEIVERLLANSKTSVATMGRLNDSFSAQEEKLNTTREELRNMRDKVNGVADAVDEIAGRIDGLNTSKKSLTEIISDLSAISEENAASTEETNASMQELVSTFTIINDAAASLKNLAEDLKRSVEYFKE
ncbi:MAG: methyl-accepting chemotaxis protein [Lachnospiraceae bacterium]|uniref:HAMP domain-containing protein n=1 Tax=Candidatus Weimeria bifida TaxID=2599074 RepID=A0A6N7J1E6_9FIRM|nr:HAMP domain-containing protein [Candidatus Weimeria bifida]RRF96549.1 MAG: methyl-accepting chemotaxis protein [Lachnospiraceae bacterium]